MTLQRLRGPQADRLPVTLYYEALCPYCMEFVTTQLSPSMIRRGRLPFTDLTLVPYGNARVGLHYLKLQMKIYVEYETFLKKNLEILEIILVT